MDVTNFQEMKECCKKVDVIIFSCGRSQRAEWTAVDPKVDDACFRVNTLGPTVLAREYLKTLKTNENGWNDSSIKISFIYDLGFIDSVE
uniref:NAD(P)-bd_dom domain-containing protein n=1 Tax=Angiostrongylus cantonensis TaxID=6313 RepID=A0A0K0DEK5_ANGCA